MAKPKSLRTATFGAGCFWHVQEAFDKMPGVAETEVGFMGGHTEQPSYKEVCSGKTGHAEVVSVLYDPSRITYRQLLDIFWMVHDPTQKNRQGPDVGEQYRSVIFYHGPGQKRDAEASKKSEQKKLDRPIATVIEKAGKFWRAEEHHQKYYKKGIVQKCLARLR